VLLLDLFSPEVCFQVHLDKHPEVKLRQSMNVIWFFFSLFHQHADNEALTRLLQTTMFLVASPILVKLMFFSFRSSLTLSIQIWLLPG